MLGEIHMKKIFLWEESKDLSVYLVGMTDANDSIENFP